MHFPIYNLFLLFFLWLAGLFSPPCILFLKHFSESWQAGEAVGNR